jgi:hypothetical protein
MHGVDMTVIDSTSVKSSLRYLNECLQQAKELRQQEQWGEAINISKEIILQIHGPQGLLKTALTGTPVTQLNDLLAKCYTGIMQCQLGQETLQCKTGIREILSYKDIDQIIKSAVESTDRCALKNRCTVYHWFYSYFSAQEGLYREDNMGEAAEAFYHWAKVCRMRYFQHHLRLHLPPLANKRRGEVWYGYLLRFFRDFFKTLQQNISIIGIDLREWLFLVFWGYATGHRGGVIRSLFTLVIIPWIIFGFCFWIANNCVMQLDAANPTSTVEGVGALIYALSFSISTFTGAGPANFSFADKPLGHFIAIIEVGWGYLVTVIILNQLLTTISSLAPQSPKKLPPSLDDNE